MNNKIFYNRLNNVRNLSFLILMIFCYKNFSKNNFFLLITWCIYIITIDNVRKISKKKKVYNFFRQSFYFLPFLLPLIILEKPYKFFIEKPKNSSYIIIIIFYFIWFFSNKKQIFFLFNKNYIILNGKIEKFSLIISCYNLVAAAICEEIFFRGYILSLDDNIFILGTISIIYFILIHYIVEWKDDFNKKNFFDQGLFSFISIILVLQSSSVYSSIILHLLINSTFVIRNFYIYYIFYNKNNKYLDISSVETLDELEI